MSKESIVVAPAMQKLLLDYSKAVLRDRPSDVLEYSAQWFVDKKEEESLSEV